MAVVAGAILVLTGKDPAAADEALWRLLADGNQVVLIRHASAPGFADPAYFRVDDCATQRNLSEAGREEARRIGAAFRARGIEVHRVLSSPWCRCLETARLAFGHAEPWEPLRSLHHEPRESERRTRALRSLVTESRGRGTLVLVTHNVNIRLLTGITPASGEMVIVTPLRGGQLRVAGRLAPDALPGAATERNR